MRDLHFPTPIYIFQHNDPSLNIQLEKDIVDWSNKDKGVTRTNFKDGTLKLTCIKDQNIKDLLIIYMKHNT